MLNKVILIGRLGKDPEVRYMPNGEAVCNFSVATSESWKDQSGQRQERIEWHNITMYRRLAEIAGQYLKKGSQVYLEGKIQTRKYQGKDGIERTAYDIIVNEMKMLGGGGNDGQQAQQAQKGTPPAPPTRQYPAAPAAPVEDVDDDIPF
jgi:single-strand DNA-binding protein